MKRFSTLFSTIYRKMALTLLVSFLAVGGLIVYVVLDLTRTYQDEIEQKLHLELASHVIHDNPLLSGGQIDEKALKNTFHSMMILGPSFEFYVLDPAGNILTYSAEPGKVKLQKVDLSPIQAYLSRSSVLPIRGDDPRSSFRQKIFSVAEITRDDKLEGYLYIIIGGEIYDDVVQLLKNSHILNIGMWSLGTTLLFSFAAVLILFAIITRPLRRLLGDIQALRSEGFANSNIDLTHWDARSNDDIHRLGSTFNAMTHTLKQQYEKVKSTDELRRELISYVSHDLRTPLASLSGYLETWLLKHHQLSEEESERLIRIAQTSGEKVTRLVDQLFELAHLDGVGVKLNLESASITELAHDVMQKLALQAQDQGITLDIEPKDPSLMAQMDIEKIERVLTNLLENALRHSESGSEIRIQVDRHGADYSVAVIDQGCGIPEDALPHIFDPHYRASNSAQGQRLHGGLGLAITRRIVELHGSTINVQSTPGLGSTFEFRLPVSPTTV